MTTTTLRKIRQHNPCSNGWRTLLTFLGKTEADDEPLPLTTILQSNGLDDALWCLRTITVYDKQIIRFALACAQEVKHLMTDQRSLDVLDAVERHLESPLSKQELDRILEAARAAAWAAEGAEEAEEAEASVWAAAWAVRVAAWTAEWAVTEAAEAAAWTARTAAEAVARAARAAWAVRAAAWAAARARQARIFEEIFG